MIPLADVSLLCRRRNSTRPLSLASSELSLAQELDFDGRQIRRSVAQVPHDEHAPRLPPADGAGRGPRPGRAAAAGHARLPGGEFLRQPEQVRFLMQAFAANWALREMNPT